VFVAEQMAFEFEYESKHGKSELNIELEWR